MIEIEHSNYDNLWVDSRIKFMIKKYTEDFWKGKRVLELGSCHGSIGNHFRKLGSEVLSVEGQIHNINYIKKTFPDLKVIQSNLDSNKWMFGYFDIIINFGLIYHLENYHKEHIINCINNCNMMFIETVINDSNDPVITFDEQLIGADQGLSNRKGMPSIKYIENIFDECKVDYKIYNNWNIMSRRLWIVEKNKKIKIND